MKNKHHHDHKKRVEAINGTQAFLIQETKAAVVMTIVVYPRVVEADNIQSEILVTGSGISDEVFDHYRQEVAGAMLHGAKSLAAGETGMSGIEIDLGDNDERVRD